MLESLAEIVVAEGLTDKKAVASAAEVADTTGVPMVVSLVRDHNIDEVALVAALKKRIRIKTLDPAKLEFDSDALRELSRDDCRRMRVMPVSVGMYGEGPRLLRVAMADPTDAVTIAEVEHLSGCVAEPALVTLSAVEEMIETGYRHFVTKVMSRTGGLHPIKDPAKKKRQPKKTIPTSTVPFQRVQDEADPAVRVQALVTLLVDKKVITEGEYADAVRTILKGD